MNQVATQITLSVADRVRDWSRLERDLAMTLRGLHGEASPLPAPVSLMPEESALSVHIVSPLVVDEPTRWADHPAEAFGPYDVAPPPPMAPVGAFPDDPPVYIFEDQGAPSDVEAAVEMEMPIVPASPPAPPGPFDEFITALTDAAPAPPINAGPLPPPSRFMVRVAPVGQPHRATKRNYDYFEELNARLAAQSAARLQGEQH
jgi:hypothetical protein